VINNRHEGLFVEQHSSYKYPKSTVSLYIITNARVIIIAASKQLWAVGMFRRNIFFVKFFIAMITNQEFMKFSSAKRFRKEFKLMLKRKMKKTFCKVNDKKLRITFNGHLNCWN